jgi:hypothetical protein
MKKPVSLKHTARKRSYLITIHNVRDKDGQTTWPGANPFNNHVIPGSGFGFFPDNYATMYQTYDWVNDNGYANLGTWIEQAFIRTLKTEDFGISKKIGLY